MERVQNQTAREFLLKARKSLEEGKYQEAVIYATASLDLIMELARINIFGKNEFSISNLNSVKGILVEDTWGKQKLDSNIAKEFQIMEEILLCYVLEINSAYYIRSRNMAGSTEMTMAGTPSYIPSSYSLKEEGFNISDAQCSVTYCTNTVVEVESKLDSLNKPFSL